MICDSRFESQIAIAVKSCDLERFAHGPFCVLQICKFANSASVNAVSKTCHGVGIFRAPNQTYEILGFSRIVYFQQTRVYPYPLGAGSAKPNPKMGAPRPRKHFISRVFCAQRGTETMVSDHGHGVGVDPETVISVC